MLRDPGLVPLSRQHQHALALCVRIQRTRREGMDLSIWREEISRHFTHEIQQHFAAEEAVVFPAAQRFEGLVGLVEELREEHRRLREDFSRAQEGTMNREQLLDFARRLVDHIRKEERQLFEGMQAHMDAEEMRGLGVQLAEALSGSGQGCLLPDARTRPGAKADESWSRTK